MFESLFGRQPQRPSPAMVIARLNERLLPFDRGEVYEDPLQAMLEAKGLGEVTGGGTEVGELGEVVFCDVEIVTVDTSPSTVGVLIQMLEHLGAPKGSKLVLEDDREIPFGKLEGLAIYLNGVDLPAEVYQACDVNFLIDELGRLLGDAGQLHGTWQGPTETALYWVGPSYEEMCRRLAEFASSYPLCQKSRWVRTA